MRWEAHTGSVRSLIFMPDSQMIASGGDDQLKLWDVKTGQCRRVLHNHDGTVWAITASPDGQMIILDGLIKVWNLNKTNMFLYVNNSIGRLVFGLVQTVRS